MTKKKIRVRLRDVSPSFSWQRTGTVVSGLLRPIAFSALTRKR